MPNSTKRPRDPGSDDLTAPAQRRQPLITGESFADEERMDPRAPTSEPNGLLYLPELPDPVSTLKFSARKASHKSDWTFFRTDPVSENDANREAHKGPMGSNQLIQHLCTSAGPSCSEESTRQAWHRFRRQAMSLWPRDIVNFAEPHIFDTEWQYSTDTGWNASVLSHRPDPIAGRLSRGPWSEAVRGWITDEPASDLQATEAGPSSVGMSPSQESPTATDVELDHRFPPDAPLGWFVKGRKSQHGRKEWKLTLAQKTTQSDGSTTMQQLPEKVKGPAALGKTLTTIAAGSSQTMTFNSGSDRSGPIFSDLKQAVTKYAENGLTITAHPSRGWRFWHLDRESGRLVEDFAH